MFQKSSSDVCPERVVRVSKCLLFLESVVYAIGLRSQMAWVCILVLCAVAGGLDIWLDLSVLEFFSTKQEQWLYSLRALVPSAGDKSLQSCSAPVRRRSLREVDLCDQAFGVLWTAIAGEV